MSAALRAAVPITQPRLDRRRRANAGRGWFVGGREYLTAKKCGTEKLMHVRMNMLAGDPARLGEVTRYLEGTVRSHVEGQHGNRGLACLTNADLGVCIVASYWDTLDAMTASEQTVQVSRKEATELLGGTVTVEHYEVPVFVRRSRPQGKSRRAAEPSRLRSRQHRHADRGIQEHRRTSAHGHARPLQRSHAGRPGHRALHRDHRVG